MTASIQSRPFGTLPNGERVEAWQLTGIAGLLLECITYGGIVTRLLAPDCNGQSADVVLGFNDLEPYLTGTAYFGAIVGRVAGRIPAASICIEGEPHALAANDPPNHLHGGLRGFDKCLWHAEPAIRPDGAPSLQLTMTSPDRDQGYPGTVHVRVSYTVISRIFSRPNEPPAGSASGTAHVLVRRSSTTPTSKHSRKHTPTSPSTSRSHPLCPISPGTAPPASSTRFSSITISAPTLSPPPPNITSADLP